MTELSTNETPAKPDDAAGIDTADTGGPTNSAMEIDSIHVREQLLSQLSGLVPATTAESVALARASSPRPSLLRVTIINAMIGIGIGSFFFLVVEILAQPTIPITPLGVVSLFVMSALIGELTLLFDLQLPYWTILLMHCPLTFALVIGWILANRWFIVLSRHFAGFAALFIGIYLLVWVGAVLHGWLLTERLNRTLRQRNQQHDI
ncbi:DUF3021 domain-containing protein [Bifidobacterium sp.]|uniref:DUF3021 domain-containing protein n=1 Tax=Bifidobacterium sp. TaxID=41200 RepID=UPI0025C264D6|nr:DUF3021 domain-containing protein [Bifidobacterium sp.]MCH4209724.1 DUF3021 domain-containing protein [Bifidobacterium sp.]MCI1224506.1 DUF3021 domain-containing protein [Bifidobacterium sp.]